MPSRICPECGKITTCNLKPDYCAWCGCSLIGQPFVKEDNKVKQETKVKKVSSSIQIKLF